MSPSQHIDWFADNTEWFINLAPSALTEAVPACPGWTVENVFTHLSYGLGLSYPHALAAAPDCSPAEAFADVERPTELPTGADVVQEFTAVMGNCLSVFKHTDPEQPCYTYQGPGIAAFWFRRAAIETTLHRMDVAEALDLDEPTLSDERAHDAVAEAIEFALPLAATWTDTDAPAIVVRVDSSSNAFKLGSGEPSAEIAGDCISLLSALWGRHSSGVRVAGDAQAAALWMSAVEKAFAGR